MSYSLDMDGWEPFNTPFSSPVKTASPRQQERRSQQKLSEAAQHNTIPTTAQRNSSPTQSQKTPQPARQMANTQQKPSAVKQPNPIPSTLAPASDKKPAPVSAPVQAALAKQEPADSQETSTSTQPATPQKELMLDLSSGSGTAPVDDTAKHKAHEASEAKRRAEWEEKQKAKKQAEEAALQNRLRKPIRNQIKSNLTAMSK